MKVKYSYFRCKEQLKYEFTGQKVNITYFDIDGNIYTDDFNFTVYPDGHATLIDSNIDLEHHSQPPILNAKKKDGELYLTLLKYYDYELTDNERKLSWETVDNSINDVIEDREDPQIVWKSKTEHDKEKFNELNKKKKEKIKNEASNEITERFPLFDQINLLLGIKDKIKNRKTGKYLTKEEVKEAISNIQSQSEILEGKLSKINNLDNIKDFNINYN